MQVIYSALYHPVCCSPRGLRTLNSNSLDQNIYPQTMHQQLRWLWIEPAAIEKHVEKGHVTHVESNGSGDVNKPDPSDRNNTPANPILPSIQLGQYRH